MVTAAFNRYVFRRSHGVEPWIRIYHNLGQRTDSNRILVRVVRLELTWINAHRQICTMQLYIGQEFSCCMAIGIVDTIFSQ